MRGEEELGLYEMRWGARGHHQTIGSRGSHNQAKKERGWGCEE